MRLRYPLTRVSGPELESRSFSIIILVGPLPLSLPEKSKLVHYFFPTTLSGSQSTQKSICTLRCTLYVNKITL